jgi:hypothetical protein
VVLDAVAKPAPLNLELRERRAARSSQAVIAARRTRRGLVPCAVVEATLVTAAQPAVLEAFNSDGTQAGVLAMTGTQNVAETLPVTGTSIDRAVITARADESVLLRFCFEPLPR